MSPDGSAQRATATARFTAGDVSGVDNSYDDARIAQMVQDFGDAGVLRGARATRAAGG